MPLHRIWFPVQRAGDTPLLTGLAHRKEKYKICCGEEKMPIGFTTFFFLYIAIVKCCVNCSGRFWSRFYPGNIHTGWRRIAKSAMNPSWHSRITETQIFWLSFVELVYWTVCKAVQEETCANILRLKSGRLFQKFDYKACSETWGALKTQPKRKWHIVHSRVARPLQQDAHFWDLEAFPGISRTSVPGLRSDVHQTPKKQKTSTTLPTFAKIWNKKSPFMVWFCKRISFLLVGIACPRFRDGGFGKFCSTQICHPQTCKYLVTLLMTVLLSLCTCPSFIMIKASFAMFMEDIRKSLHPPPPAFYLSSCRVLGSLRSGLGNQDCFTICVTSSLFSEAGNFPSLFCRFPTIQWPYSFFWIF